MHRSCAAERDEREIARIDAATDASCGSRSPLRVDDLQDASRHRLRRELELLAELSQRSPRTRGSGRSSILPPKRALTERAVPSSKVPRRSRWARFRRGRSTRGRGGAPALCGPTRNAPASTRAIAAATGADRVYVDGRSEDWLSGESTSSAAITGCPSMIRLMSKLVPPMSTQISCGSAISRLSMRQPTLPPTGPDISVSTPRLSAFSPHQAAVRLEQVDLATETALAERGAQPTQVAAQDRRDVRVDGDGAGALVLAPLATDVARRRDENLGCVLAQVRRGLLLVRRIAVAVQEHQLRATRSRARGSARAPARARLR